MSSKGSKKYIIFYIIAVIIVCLLISIFRYAILNNDSSLYKNKNKNESNIAIKYPYFKNNKIDDNIAKYLDEIDRNSYDKIEYIVNTVSDYISIVFIKYKDNKIAGYNSFIYDKENNLTDINAIISDENILKDKIKIYLDNNKIEVKSYPDVTFDYLLFDNYLEVILTIYEEGAKKFIIVDINYTEINEILKISYEIDKDYIISLTTTKTITTTTTTTTTIEKQKDSIPPEDNNNKIIAFTFDDGPSKYTSEIMDVLEEYGAKATFFEVGYMIKTRKDTVKEVYERGFEIGNHTTDHSNLNKLTTAKAKEKIYDNNELFKEITGIDFPLIRPPYGNCKSSVQAVIDVPIIMWSVDSRDWESRNAEKIIAVVKSETKSGDIVLFHDLYPSTLEAIKTLVPYYTDQGYKIVGVSELFQLNGKELENGKKYYNAR